MAPLFVFLVGLFMWAVEHFSPRTSLPRVRGWWPRTLLLNALQVGSIFLFGRFIDAWFQAHAVFSLRALPDIVAATLGYVVLTFFYYWWHRGRHENESLWRWVHQLHHSPARIEVWTSFYKHPLELLLNGALSSGVMFVLLGLSPAQAALATALSGLAELFYHWNIKTPRWLGYVIQRPEMHAIHHERGRHRNNYGDLPVWDMLFGTFENPETFDGECGFADEGEERFGAVLLGQRGPNDSASTTWRRIPWIAVLIGVVGLSAPLASVLGARTVQQMGSAMLVSPAPRVFTAHNDIETFSQRYTLSYSSRSRHVRHAVTRRDFEALAGPYNRKNVFGAQLSYSAPFANNAAFITMRDAVAPRALCGRTGLIAEIGLPAPSPGSVVVVQSFSLARGDREPVPFQWEVTCPY